MTGPPPAVARLRVAVRRTLAPLPKNRPVLVACSGGPDSMALAAAAGFVAPRLGVPAGLVTVDHGLQEGSAHQAAAVAVWAGEAGFDPVEVATVDVAARPGADEAGRRPAKPATAESPPTAFAGPEAAARAARYRALDEAATRHDAAAVLLGHTRDDQAETVLLALARGSGPRGIAAMPRRRGRYLRPLLDITRADTVQTCRDLELPAWDDPHNTDPAYLRSRLRAAMPVLTEALGERFVSNLANTATLIAADNDALDALAADLLARARTAEPAGDGLAVEVLRDAHGALRSRVLRAWVLEHGGDADGLGRVHIDAVEALVIGWRGQGPVHLPGRLEVRREGTALFACRPGR